MKKNRIGKALLAVFGSASVVFLTLSVSSLHTGTDLLDTAFITPWFSWQIDAMLIYLLTAVLCLVTAKFSMLVFYKKEQDHFEVLIRG